MRWKAYMSQINPQSTYMKYLNDKRSFGNSRYSDSRLDRPTACYQTSWQLSTVEILQHWSCWTYLLRSSRSTTTFCCRGYRQALALTVLPSSGSSRTWPAVPTMSVVVRPDRPLFSWYVVLGQFWSSCIQLTWFHSSSSTACRRTSTLMTLRFMVQWSIWCRRPAAEDYWMSDSCCRLDVGQSAPTEFR